MQDFKYWKLVRSRWDRSDFYIWLGIWVLLTLLSCWLGTLTATSGGIAIVLTWYQILGIWAAFSLVKVLIFVFIGFILSSISCFIVYLGCKKGRQPYINMYHVSVQELEKRKNKLAK